jgi:hypothetical protein
MPTDMSIHPNLMLCSVCGGLLKESETECPVCKGRAYEAQVLKQRLDSIQSLLRPKQNQKELRLF